MKCKIYPNRPDICKQFPLTAGEITEFHNCTYTFDENGVRHGECDPECSDCCVHMVFDGVKHEVCPHRGD
jgi:hypothetical protein